MATPFKLRNGMLLLSTEAPGGIYNAAQLKKIAQLCDGDAAIVKATEDQRLALFVAPDKAKQVAAELRATGLGIRNYQDGLHQPVNCIGELCGDYLQDAMGLSMELSQELARVTLSSSLKIGINGCARCCVPTHTLDVSAIGDTNGYRVSLGGKNSQIPEMASFMAEGVPAEKLPKMLTQVVAIYKELAEAGESLQDVMERCGSGRFVEALAPYSADAAGDDADDAFGAGEAPPVAEASTDDELNADLPADHVADVELSMGDDLAADEFGSPELLGDELVVNGELESPELLGDELAGDSALANPELLSDDLSLGNDLGGEDELVGMAHDAGGADAELMGDDLGEMTSLSGDDALLGGELGDEPLIEEIGASTELSAMDDDGLAAHSDEDILGEGEIPLDDGLSLDMPMDDIEINPAVTSGMLPHDLAPFPDDDELVDNVAAIGAGSELGELGSLEPDEIDDFTPVAMPAPPAVPTPIAKPVLAAVPAAPSFGSDDDADLAAAVEVDGDEADAFEAKLEESIADEESHPVVEDENSADRLAAMQLVESDTALPSVDAVSANLGVDDSFDNLEIDHQLGDDMSEEVISDDLDSDALAMPADDDTMADITADLEPEEFGVAEVPTAAVSPIVPKAAPAAPATIARPMTATAPSASGFEFKGIDVGDGGRLTLSFSSGATVVLDPRTLAPGMARDFTVGGKAIVITRAVSGFSVDVDGVSFFLPAQAA